MIGTHRAVLLSAVLAAMGCTSNTSTSGANLPEGYYISITNMSFSPANLAAPSGATVVVLGRRHRVMPGVGG